MVSSVCVFLFLATLIQPISIISLRVTNLGILNPCVPTSPMYLMSARLGGGRLFTMVASFWKRTIPTVVQQFVIQVITTMIIHLALL